MLWANPPRSARPAVLLAQGHASGRSHPRAPSRATLSAPGHEPKPDATLLAQAHSHRRIGERTPRPQGKRPKSLGACSTVYTNLEMHSRLESPPSGASWADGHGQVPGESSREQARASSHPAPNPEAPSSVSTPDQAARGPQYAIVASLCDTAPASWHGQPEGWSLCAPRTAVTYGRSIAPEDVCRAPPQPQAAARRAPTQVDVDLVWDPNTC